MTRTSTPWPLTRLKTSMPALSDVVPNGARVRVIAARITGMNGRTASRRSEPHGIGDPDCRRIAEGGDDDRAGVPLLSVEHRLACDELAPGTRRNIGHGFLLAADRSTARPGNR